MSEALQSVWRPRGAACVQAPKRGSARATEGTLRVNQTAEHECEGEAACMTTSASMCARSKAEACCSM
jgi:hypothetical protein